MSKAAARNVLEKLDSKPFGFFHLKMIVITGMGFLTDAYDLFSISLLTNLIGRIYFQDNPYYLNNTVDPGKLPINLNAAISAVALIGALVGQFVFGAVADVVGRKTGYGVVLVIMMFTGFTQAMSFGNTGFAVIGTLCFWRFLLGVGVGGDYPLSATIMSEYSSTTTRGACVGAVFAMQGMGYLLASCVTAIVSAAFNTAYPNGPYPTFVGVEDGVNKGKWASNTVKNQEMYYQQLMKSNPPENDYCWRTILALSAVPAATTLYFRLHMAETPRFTLHVLKNATAMNNDMALMLEGEDENITTMESPEDDADIADDKDLSFYSFLRHYGVHLTGAALSWFFLDVGFYSQNLFQKDVFIQVGFVPPSNRLSALQEQMVVAKAQGLIALGSTIPGYWATVLTVDIYGRKPIQIGGFIAMTAFMAAMSGGHNKLLNPNNPGGLSLSSQQPTKRNGWIAMYAFTFFFANWGPNSTTYIVPAELFPTRWRATGHGICAAIGKAGAIIGSFGFLFASQPFPLETTWSFPCKYATDFNYDSNPPFERLGCIVKNLCPIGRESDTSVVPSSCNLCDTRKLSGCSSYGLGIEGALGILAGINFCGLLTTFLIPETMGRSLEELNGEVITDFDIENEARKLCIAEGNEFEGVASGVIV